jgi:hypothetical protein
MTSVVEIGLSVRFLFIAMDAEKLGHGVIPISEIGGFKHKCTLVQIWN